ncbi:MAG: hypothetical protein HY361_04710 [Candidatus Aenigmarchaeota archaeon]|nr:hypothetical protein [Candidatus Aenigmarchaeota archaeon]
MYFVFSLALISFSSYAQIATSGEVDDFSNYHTIHLSKGWNVIGYPLDVEIPLDTIKNACKLEPYNGYEVHEYTGDQKNPWTYPTKFQPGKGYYINSKEDCSVALLGEALKLEKLNLKSGWNLITSPKLVAFNNILGTCKGKLDDEEHVLGLNEETGKMDLRTNTLEPGSAYWIFSKANCELTFSDRQIPLSKGEIKESSFKSNALKTEKKYNIYLPSSYSTSSQRYPVLYLMHGAGLLDSYKSWIKDGHIDEIIENLRQESRIEEMILVMPSVDRSGLENGCSGPGEIAPQSCGNYEDYIVQDLIPFIDSTYRTISDKSARGIIGFSSTAHGAYWIAFRNPELFSFVAGYSGYYQNMYSIILNYKNLVPGVAGINIGPGLVKRIFNEVKIPPKEKISHMKLYLEVSKYDPLSERQTKKFHKRLEKAGIKHTYVITPSGFQFQNIHYWPFIVKNANKAVLAFNDNLVQQNFLVKAG